MTSSGLVPRRSRLACSCSRNFVRASVCSSFEMFLISASRAAVTARLAETLYPPGCNKNSAAAEEPCQALEARVLEARAASMAHHTRHQVRNGPVSWGQVQ